MLSKMSEAQRSMLQAGAQRDDRLMTPPLRARGAVLASLAAKLIEAGWVKEVKARDGSPVWGKGMATGEVYALKLTAKGLKAAAGMEAVDDGAKAGSAPVAAGTLVKASKTTSPSARDAAVATPDASQSRATLPAISAPRPNSKIARVLDMLAADAGATIVELMAMTGWLEHTTRAALTGLRHRGYALSLDRNARDGASIYRIVARDEQAAQ